MNYFANNIQFFKCIFFFGFLLTKQFHVCFVFLPLQLSLSCSLLSFVFLSAPPFDLRFVVIVMYLNFIISGYSVNRTQNPIWHYKHKNKNKDPKENKETRILYDTRHAFLLVFISFLFCLSHTRRTVTCWQVRSDACSSLKLCRN